MRNRWIEGIAVMEAAATRGVHGDPRRAATEFLDSVERWERIGDRAQQWLNLRYVLRLLARIGDVEGAAVLHHALVAAGRPSPLPDHRLEVLSGRLGPGGWSRATRHGSELGATEAASWARDRLERLCAAAAGEWPTTEADPQVEPF